MSHLASPDRMVRDRTNALLSPLVRLADGLAHLAWILRDDRQPEAVELSRAFEDARTAMLTHRAAIGQAYARWIAARRGATAPAQSPPEAQP